MKKIVGLFSYFKKHRNVSVGMLIAISVFTICIVTGYKYGRYVEQKEYNKQFEPVINEVESLEELGKKVFDFYLIKDSTIKELSEFSSEKTLDAKELPFSKDSFLKQQLKEEQKVLNVDYDSLEESHQKSLDTLYTSISSNLSYKLSKKEENKQNVRKFTYECKSFVLYQYMIDLEKLTNLLLDTHYETEMVVWQYDEMSEEEQKEFDVYQYIAKVKAMELLNSHLTRYVKIEPLGSVIVYFQKADSDAEWEVVNANEVYNNLYGINKESYKKEDDEKRFLEILPSIYKKIGDKDILEN